MKRLVAVSLFVCAFAQPAVAADRLSQGIKLFDLHRYAEAETLLDQVISAGATDARALYYDALTHHYLGQSRKAAGVYQQIVAEFPGTQFAALSHQALEQLGAEALPAATHTEECPSEKKAADSESDTPTTAVNVASADNCIDPPAPYKKYLEKAAALGGVGDSEKYYLEALREAENRGPNDPAVREVLPAVAEFYIKKEQYDRAERLLVRCLDYTRRAWGSSSLDFAVASDKLGRLYLTEGYMGLAVESFGQERDVLEGALYKARCIPHSDTSAIRGALASVLETQAAIAAEFADRIGAALLHAQAVEYMAMEN